jgi:hypothetical protein
LNFKFAEIASLQEGVVKLQHVIAHGSVPTSYYYCECQERTALMVLAADAAVTIPTRPIGRFSRDWTGFASQTGQNELVLILVNDDHRAIALAWKSQPATKSKQEDVEEKEQPKKRVKLGENEGTEADAVMSGENTEGVADSQEEGSQQPAAGSNQSADELMVEEMKEQVATLESGTISLSVSKLNTISSTRHLKQMVVSSINYPDRNVCLIDGARSTIHLLFETIVELNKFQGADRIFREIKLWEI